MLPLPLMCTGPWSILPALRQRSLLDAYRRLPPFPDVEEGLTRLEAAGFRIFAFSNGRASDARAVLDHAKIGGHFLDIESTDELRSFKPNPSVYAHFLRRSSSTGSHAWLVSSNSFDVIAALSAGMRAAWIRRTASAVLDPWGFQPTLVASDLLELNGQLGNHGT